MHAVTPQMVRDGLLKLPEWVDDYGWNYTKPNNSYAEKSECVSLGYGEWGDFLFNVRLQRHYERVGKDNVKLPLKYYMLQHYVQYKAIHPYLSFKTGGKEKMEQREKVKKEHPMMYKLIQLLWPCDNEYLGVCEDSAYDMKKGAAQKLLIGQRSPDDITKMVCKKVDTAQVKPEEVKLSAKPEDDVYVGAEGDDPAILKIKSKCKCGKIAWKAGWVEKSQCEKSEIEKYADENKPWDWGKEKFTQAWQLDEKDSEYEMKMEVGVVTERMADSNEYAWYMRKCCARSARLGLEGSK